MEDLCAKCILQNQDQAALVDTCRMRQSDAYDRKLVLALPSGRALLDALYKSRPKRCEELRRILGSGPRQSANVLPFAKCAELTLTDKVMINAYTDLSEIITD